VNCCARKNVCFLYVPLELERSQQEDAGEGESRSQDGMGLQRCQTYSIFHGSSIRLPFFKDNVCPGTFASFLGDCGHDSPQVGLINTTTPMGKVKVNFFHAPVPDDNLIGPINHLYLIGTTEVH